MSAAGCHLPFDQVHWLAPPGHLANVLDQMAGDTLQHSRPHTYHLLSSDILHSTLLSIDNCVPCVADVLHCSGGKHREELQASHRAEVNLTDTVSQGTILCFSSSEKKPISMTV